MGKRRKKTQSDRRRRSLDLRLLGETLLNTGVCEDVSPLQSAADQCAAPATGGGDWAYDVTLLMFRLRTLPGARPAGLDPIFAKLSVSAVGHRAEDVQGADPFVKLAIDFAVVGTLSSGESSVTTIAAWHFDRHVGTTDEQSIAVHPLYHAQYGRRQMQTVALGETLLCDGPRLIYPPMDAILAVDFVASNFLHESWLKLRQDTSYVRLVAQSYREFWFPWFSCVTASWAQNAHIFWHQHERLCPALPPPSTPDIVQQGAPRVRHRK